MPFTPATGDENEQLVRSLTGVLPRQGMWTEEDYLWLTERTNRLIELTDGRLEVLPMPTEQHQRVVLALYRLVYAFLLANQTGGVLLVAPMRLRLWDTRYREPDLLYLRSADDPRRKNDYWEGADLVIEVVSPGNPHLDRVIKRGEYARKGIAEYWIVDPVEPQKERITVLTLEGSEYVEYGDFSHGDTVTSALLPALRLDVTTVFADHP
jgi:Uma2 family endonuclease